MPTNAPETADQACGRCRAPLAPEARFCGACGAPASRPKCPACGWDAAPGARFCIQCGQAIASEVPEAPSTHGAASDGERRQVTIVFCDLVGSTELSHRLDPEDFRAAIRDYQHAVGAIVERLDGYVAQYLGDGVLVYFGFPRAHEHDAERAVRAGLEIVEAMRELDGPWGDAAGEPLQARVGIHTGQVLIGEIGAGTRHEWLALGEAPPVAARLQGVAQPGTVVVSGETRKLVGRRFDMTPLGAHELKGVDRPVDVWVVDRVVHAASRFDVAARAELTPLVGRAHELALLLDRWRLAQRGDGQVVVISGEAGLGKSRLLRELRQALGVDAGTTLRFECSPFHVNTAYQPVAGALEELLGLTQDTADAAQKFEALRRHAVDACGLSEYQARLIAAVLGVAVEEAGDGGPASTAARKRDTIEALVELVCATARDGALMVFEDAHWADPSTLDFLDQLLARAPTSRLLVALSHRPEFQPSWTRHGHVAAISLSTLGREQAGAIISRLAGGKTLPRGLSEEIVKKAGGVPLFVEELTRTVLDSEQLRETEGGFELTADNASLDVPVTLRASLMSRLDRDPRAKEVAQVGSVIGRTFRRALIDDAAQLDVEVLASGLSRLSEAGILFCDGEGENASYTFRHALLQDLAYDSIPRARRHVLHRSIAEALERTDPDSVSAAPELLAHHWTEGQNAERAIPHWHRAGQNALAQHAHVEAIGHLRKGIELLGAQPDTPERTRRLIELQIALGAPLIATKGYAAAEVRESFDRARELCANLGSTPELFHVLWGLAAFYLLRAELATALELARDCLEQAETARDEDLLLEAHSWLGTIAFYLGEMETAQRHFDAAEEIYDRGGRDRHAIEYGLDPAVLSKAHLFWRVWLQARPDDAMAMERETIELARRLAHPLSTVHALNFAAVHRRFRRDAEGAKAIVGEELRLSNEHQFPHYVAYATILGGWARAALGDPAGGIDQIKEGLAARRVTGAELARPLFLTLLAEAYRAEGRISEAIASVEEARTVAALTGERWWLPEVHRLRGELLLELDEAAAPGDVAREAVACFDRAFELARSHASLALELRAASSMVRASSRLGARASETARERLREALAAADRSQASAEITEAEALLATE